MNTLNRTGILGGTFDPIHQGHLDAAKIVSRSLQLKQVLLIPVGLENHRAVLPRASAYHRFAMLGLAATDYTMLQLCDIELRSTKPSYTSLTLQRLAVAGYDPSQLFFITGADAFAEITSWYDFPAVLDRSHFAVVSRPGHPVSELHNQLPDLANRMKNVKGAVSSESQSQRDTTKSSILLIDANTCEVSSSEIRHRIAIGKPLTGLTPPNVETYIHQHRLYLPNSKNVK